MKRNVISQNINNTDFVEVSGQKGTVKEVGLRSTRLRTVDGTTVVIPNSKMADDHSPGKYGHQTQPG